MLYQKIFAGVEKQILCKITYTCIQFYMIQAQKILLFLVLFFGIKGVFFQVILLDRGKMNKAQMKKHYV